MVGSVLVERMRAERDFDHVEPHFFSTSQVGSVGPEIGRKGLAALARAAPVPLIAIGGLNAMRAAEVLAAGVSGIAVMGGIMRAADPAREMAALIATVGGSATLR